MAHLAHWCVGLAMTFCGISSAFADPVLPVDKIVIFGDSVTDNGNLFALTTWGHEHIPQIPVIPKPPYWQGRFSDGPVWSEYLPAAFVDGDHAVPALNYAYGGAWAEGVAHTHQPFPPDFGTEVDMYLAKHLHDDKTNTLYIVFFGANDYLMGRDDPQAAAAQVVAAEGKVVEELIVAGARNIILVGLPDIGITPRANRLGPWYQQNLHELSMENNAALQQLVRKFIGWSDWFAGLRVSYFDADAVMEPLFHHPENYGLTDVTHACYGGWPVLANMPETIPLPMLAQLDAVINVPLQSNPQLATAYVANGDEPPAVCDNPAEHLFWDEVHSTTHAYKIFAKSACEKLADFGYGVASADGKVKPLQCDRA